MAWTKSESIGRTGDHVLTLSEEVVADQDKILDVASDVGVDGVIEILGIRVEYVADATVGVRAIALEVQDSGDDIIFGSRFDALADVAASTTSILELIEGFGQLFVTGLVPASTGPHLSYLPRLILGQNDKIRVFTEAVSGAIGAADDMIVHIRALQR